MTANYVIFLKVNMNWSLKHKQKKFGGKNEILPFTSGLSVGQFVIKYGFLRIKYISYIGTVSVDIWELRSSLKYNEHKGFHLFIPKMLVFWIKN